MKVVYILLFIALFGFRSMAQTYTCLASDVKDDDVVGFTTATSQSGKTHAEKVTVKQTLKKMRSRCRHGKLMDGKGRQIRFYFLQGCWGNPPANYLEILDRQRKEIERLKKRYIVVEMTCNPSGMPRQ